MSTRMALIVTLLLLALAPVVHADPLDSARELWAKRKIAATAQACLQVLTPKPGSSAAVQQEAVTLLARALTETDWDNDGCADFGTEDVAHNCLVLDPRIRPRLYVAAVIEPKFDDFPNWTAGLPPATLARVKANLAMREKLRPRLANLADSRVIAEYARRLYLTQDDDHYRQAVLVYALALTRWPDVREAEEWQRNTIRSFDILAAAATFCSRTLERNPKDTAARLGLAMALADQEKQVLARRKYLTLFSEGTHWRQKWQRDAALTAQVRERLAHIQMDYAQLLHGQAQTLRRARDEPSALARYVEAAQAYEQWLQTNPGHMDAYQVTWTLAETLYFAGKRCDGLRDMAGRLLKLQDSSDEVIAYPQAALGPLRHACGLVQKAVTTYAKVRDWQGPRTLGDDKKPMNLRTQAQESLLVALGQLLAARASYPVGQADHLEPRQVPELPPSPVQDAADLAKNQGQAGLVRLVPLPLDPQVNAWLAGQKPETQNVAKVALQAGRLLYKNRHLQAARNRLWWLVEQLPATAEGRQAYDWFVRSLELEHDQPGLEAARKYREEHPVSH
jgi:hypothetical protein